MGLRNYVLRRLGQLVITYWAFITILFFIFRVMPGDPTTKFVLQGLSGEARQQMIEAMGLNDPLHVQYVKYMGQLLSGDFGKSFMYNGTPVLDVIVVKFWNTIFLMMAILLLAFVIGAGAGAVMAWWRGSDMEVVGILVTLVARSMPVFWSGILVLMVFAFWLDWFPVANMRSTTAEISGFWGRYFAWDFVYHAVLPVVTGVIYYMTVPTLLMRNSMLEILNADFIELKKAEGLSQFTVLYKHAARNSILPLVTVAALIGGKAIGGQVLIEVVFNWPGMGRLMVDAVQSSDYPLAQASFFFMGSVVIFFNFVADLAYAYLDPRVSYE